MPCPNRLALAALAVGLAADASAAVEGPDMLQFVNPLIGTVNGGRSPLSRRTSHVFPGASLPFGMAKAVADVNTELQGGYASDSGDITGFSHMHDSGTGGGASLGNFPLFAQTGCPGDVLDNCLFTKTLRASQRINDTVRASPGYFALSLNTSVHAEMTVSNRTALYRFTFPSTRARAPPTCRSAR
ncbi:hypothetical protein VTK73DRAFT_8741 [Phialemonium thermophilum]|uniref:Glycosyl hydrolase family 92 N-terminal domain-containing protein n=1 Tax=Phialemonium thermophilum TaxID=223376 RepID=A0ABR3W6P4_9PEZI